MDVQGALRARLIGATSAADRVYWVTRPQASALPAITLQTISGDYPQTYDGLTPTRSPRIQFDAWGLTYAEARGVCEAAITALAPKDTSNGIVFDNIQFESERDFLEQQGATDIYRTSVDLIVWHHPA